MHTTRKTWKLTLNIGLILAIAFGLMLSACGGGGGGGGGGADTTAPIANVTPGSGKLLGDGMAVVIAFSESMDTASLTLGGGLNAESDGGAWSAGNATLTISPTATWTTGSGKTLTLDAKDPAGNALATISLAYDVVAGSLHYVSATGDDANDGLSTATPKLTITAAIASATSPATVLVAGGAYSVDSGAMTPTHIVLVEGISLYGGFNADFSARDTVADASIITDMSTAAGSVTNPTRALEAGVGITAATLVDGFTFKGTTDAGAAYSSAIFVNGFNAAPTISNNLINGGIGTTASNGLFLYNGANPAISNNTIRGGNGSASSNGINVYGSKSTISGNTIYGGGDAGDTPYSYGIIFKGTTTTTINGNILIDGGDGTTGATGIFATPGTTATITGNTIFGGNNIHGASGTKAIYNGSGSGGVTVTSNSIDGGNGTSAVGIYNISVTSPISGNTITGGGYSLFSLSMSYGIMNYSGTTATISGNTIDGGLRSNQSAYAIYNLSSNPTIDNNTIRGGGTTGGAGKTLGIYSTDASPTISNNSLIDGGEGTTNSYAIYNDSASTPSISSNTINGGGNAGSTGTTYGVYNTDTGTSATINNNTLINGGEGTSAAYGIYNNSGASATISGNTLINGGGGAGGTGTTNGIYSTGTGASATISGNLEINGGEGTSRSNAIYTMSAATATISSNTVNGGGSADGTPSTYGITTGFGSSVTIDANTSIHGGTGTTNSYGVNNSLSAVVLVSNNPDINGGDGGTNSFGIRDVSTDVASASITNNIVNGGSGGSLSYGIWAKMIGSITGNTVHGGSSTATSYGMYFTGAGTPNIENNFVEGGDVATQSYGIYVISSATPDIHRNTISSRGNVISYGVYVFTTGNPNVFNNTINGGGGTWSAGIQLDSDGTGTFRNNTIYPGAGGATGYGVLHASTATKVLIENNIIFTPMTGDGICIKELGTANDPASVANNNLYCARALYVDEGSEGTVITDLVTSVDNAAVGGGTGTLAARGDISEDPLFVNVGGADNDILTMADNDWHLTPSSPLDTREGGLDLSGSFFTLDKDLVTRTAGATSASNVGAAGWSMGAYEQD